MRVSRGVIALSVALLAAPLGAQDWRGGTGRVEGKVTDPDGKPVTDAVVKLELPDRGGTELKSDKKGRWAILGLAGGKWNVDITAPGYTPRSLSVNVSETVRTPPIEVKLERAQPAATGLPPEVKAAHEKAEKAYDEGRYEEARAEYEKLLALRPDLAPRINQQIGFTFIQQKDYAKGLEYLLKVLAAEPEDAQIRAIAAQAAFDARQPEKGREILAALDERKITDPDMFFNIGVGLLNAGAVDEAVVWFGKAIAKDPSHVDGYLRRGLAYVHLGKVAEARADLQKVVELSPTTPQGELAKKALAQLE
jgi:tetratricopeptide (TPR) repeat protein